MKQTIAITLVLLLAVSMFSMATITGNYADAKQTKADKKAEKAISKSLDSFVGKGKHFANICTLSATTKTNSSQQHVYGKECVPPPPVNVPPVASIVAQAMANVNDTVTVNGNTSTDSDGTIVSYKWSGADFENNTLVSTTFVMPDKPQVTIGLIVTDNNGSSTAISAIIKNAVQPPAPNVPPTVSAGADLVVRPNTTVSLVGTATDTDGSIASATWTQTSGTIVNLTGDASTTFVSPVTNTPLTLGFIFTATDNQGASSSDSITVTVQPIITPPPPPPPPSNTVPDLNTATTTRVAVFGDVDNNNGLVTQLNLMQKYHVQYLLLAGDYAYTNGPAVLTKLTDHGFTKTNTEIAVGNHNNCGTVKAWLGDSSCYGERLLTPNIAVFSIDGNSGFDCTGTQFTTIKNGLETSNALYKLVLIHQPFATVKSTHGPNGNFACFNTVFKANGVNAVLAGHNHNYQRFLIDNIIYGVFGTGTHDTGSAMYPLNSNDFSGNQCLKCITGTNGFTILDLKINDKQINGYFVSNGDKVVDTFVN